MDESRKIASLLSSATEILYGLGLGDRVVAVSHECDFPPAASQLPRATSSAIDSSLPSEEIDRQVKKRLSAGETLYDVDWNLLRELQPSLIVTQAQCDVCSVRFEDVRKVLENDKAFAATQLISLNPTSLDDVLADVRKIALAAGAKDAGARFAAELQNRVEAVTRITSDFSPRQRPRVACIEWSDPIMIAGNWMPEMIEMAGGASGLSTAGRHSQYHSWEELIDFDPEVVIVMLCGFDLERTVEEWQRVDPPTSWSIITAVQRERIFLVDGNAYFNRSGPRLVDSLEILAHLVHPDLIPPPNAATVSPTAWKQCQQE